MQALKLEVALVDGVAPPLDAGAADDETGVVGACPHADNANAQAASTVPVTNRDFFTICLLRPIGNMLQSYGVSPGRRDSIGDR